MWIGLVAAAWAGDVLLIGSVPSWSGSYVEAGPTPSITLEIGPRGPDGWYSGLLVYGGTTTYFVRATPCPKRPDCDALDHLVVFGDPLHPWAGLVPSRPLFTLDRSSGVLVTRRGQFAAVAFVDPSHVDLTDLTSVDEALAGVSGVAVAQPVSLTAPWTALDLPLGEGVVEHSGPRDASIHYGGGSVRRIYRAYDAAILAKGWTRGAPVDADPSAARSTFVRDGARLALSVVGTRGDVSAYLVWTEAKPPSSLGAYDPVDGLTTTASGLQYRDLVVGGGAEARPGATVKEG